MNWVPRVPVEQLALHVYATFLTGIKARHMADGGTIKEACMTAMLALWSTLLGVGPVQSPGDGALGGAGDGSGDGDSEARDAGGEAGAGSGDDGGGDAGAVGAGSGDGDGGGDDDDVEGAGSGDGNGEAGEAGGEAGAGSGDAKGPCVCDDFSIVARTLSGVGPKVIDLAVRYLDADTAPDPSAVEAAAAAVSAAYAGNFTAFFRDLWELDLGIADPAEVMARYKVVALRDLAPDARVVLQLRGLHNTMQKYAVVAGHEFDAAEKGSAWRRIQPVISLDVLRALVYRDTNLPPSMVKYFYMPRPSWAALAGMFSVPGPHEILEGVGADGLVPIVHSTLMYVLLPQKASVAADAGAKARDTHGPTRICFRAQSAGDTFVTVSATTTFAALMGAEGTDPVSAGPETGTGPAGPDTDHAAAPDSIVVVYTKDDRKGTYIVRPEHWHLSLNDFVEFDVVDVCTVSWMPTRV